MNITCVIVDDEKLARDLLVEYLQQMPNIQIVGEATKGKEAVEVIDKLKPDLVFLDVQMPGMTGFDVLDEITHDPFVIFCTAYDQYAIKAFEKNAVDYLLKGSKFLKGMFTRLYARNTLYWPLGGSWYVEKLTTELEERTFKYLEEIDRRGSSCPVVWVWNGERYEFIADMIRKLVPVEREVAQNGGGWAGGARLDHVRRHEHRLADGDDQDVGGRTDFLHVRRAAVHHRDGAVAGIRVARARRGGRAVRAGEPLEKRETRSRRVDDDQLARQAIEQRAPFGGGEVGIGGYLVDI